MQVRAEEREDAPAGVLRRCLVVSGSRHEPAQDREQDRSFVPCALVVVEELMPGLRVLLYVVLDPRSRQCCRQNRAVIRAAVGDFLATLGARPPGRASSRRNLFAIAVPMPGSAWA